MSEIEQSAAELLRFTVWPYDLEHMFRVLSLNSVNLSVRDM